MVGGKVFRYIEGTVKDHIERERSSEDGVTKKEKEGFVVIVTHTVVDPRTVVVHAEDTS